MTSALRKAAGGLDKELCATEGHIESLEAEITTLRETLVWYGDEGNWNKACVDDGTVGYTWTRPIIADKGQRARDALGGRDG